MSKNFDAWMSHNEQRYGASTSSAAASPRGDDAMSYVSRQKHDNYANVVMEMKSQQLNFNQRADFDDFDDGFGFSNNNNQFRQQQGRPQSRQPSPSTWEMSNNQFETFDNSHFQQSQQQQQRQQYHNDRLVSAPSPPAEYSNANSSSFSAQMRSRGRSRPRGRDEGINNYNQTKSQPRRQGRTLYREHNNTNGSSNQRSKSTIRRTADRTQALAKLNTDDDDNASDVWSSFEGSGSWAAAGSRLASSGLRHQQQQRQQRQQQIKSYQQQQIPQQQQQHRQPTRKLDSYVANNSGFSSLSPSQTNSDEVSVSSSNQSVAARRRRVKAAADSKQQQQNQPSKPIALAPPPSSSSSPTVSVSSSKGARRNMRMRMQTKSSNTPTASVTSPTEVATNDNTSFPQQQQLESQLQSFSSSSQASPSFKRTGSMNSINSSEIDHEVNMAMSELKLTGVDMANFFNVSNNNQSPSSLGKKGRTSPITVGTKSLTLDSSSNNNVSNSGMGITNEGSRGLVVSNTISVDHHSESSSLTNDTSDWQGQGASNNIFKDSKGSTFHKSKRIVRPNELQDVNRQSQQSQVQPQPRSPSVKDRISQYKTATSTSPQLIPGSPPNKLAQILKNANDEPYSDRQQQQQHEQSLPPLSPQVNRVKNSPFRQKDEECTVRGFRSGGGKYEGNNIPSPSSPSAFKVQKKFNNPNSPSASSYAPADEGASPNPFLSQAKLRKTGVSLTDNQRQKETNEADEVSISSPQTPKKDVAALIKERMAAAKKDQSPNTELASPLNNERRSNFDALRENFTKESSPPKNSPLRREESESTLPNSDPRAALMAMIKQRANPEPEETDVRQNLSSMFANRGGQSKDETSDAASSGKPSLKNDPKYAKYMKMLKVGMPLPVVQHAMTRDGLDPSVLEGDHNKPAQEAKPAGVPLKEDPAYAKYFKMLKLGLPIGAVKNAMERDGVDSSVMDGDHNAPASASKPGGSSAKKREKDTHRRTRLHWEAIGEVNSNSVWAALAADEEIDQLEIDETEFTKLFQAEIKATPTASQSANGGSSSRNVVQVIDPKRANNGGIILARLRMSYDDMAKIVDNVDETKMTANQVQGIIEYMPTPTERKALRDYMKSSQGGSEEKFEKLCECEKFMVAMISVKQSKMKLRALLFKLQFRGCIQDLAHDVFSVEKACDELSNSVRLRKLFGIVLNIGNRLNTAGPSEKRKASAFSIQSLLKLNQAKAFDNKTTFLQYVVLVVQRNNEKLLDFKDDLPTVAKADKIYWDQCINELEEMETQLEIVRKLALHEANQKKNIYALPKKKDSQDDYDSDNLNIDEDMSLEEEVGLLRSTKIGMFALGAIKKVSQLRERVEIAKDKFSRLLEYFGEHGDAKMDVHELFAIINTFCRNFDDAREVVEKAEQAKVR